MSVVRNKCLFAIIFLFCAPVILKAHENAVLAVQFGFFAPIFFALLLLHRRLAALIHVTTFGFICGLLTLGLPGSFVGWYVSVICGIELGRFYRKNPSVCETWFRRFTLTAMSVCGFVCIQNLMSPLSHAQLSDYFSASSINTVAILAACSANVYLTMASCSTLRHSQSNEPPSERKFVTLTVIGVTSWTILEFGFRSGFITLAAFVWWLLHYFRTKFGAVFAGFTVIIAAGVLATVMDELLQLLVQMFVPGRSELSMIWQELSGNSLRTQRALDFWRLAAFDKSNLSQWSENLSFSALSDFMAGFFPVAILLLYPARSWLFNFVHLKNRNAYKIITGYLAGASSLVICLLQPDFYSLFTFFSVVSIFHWTRKTGGRSRLGQSPLPKLALQK